MYACMCVFVCVDCVCVCVGLFILYALFRTCNN